MNSKIPHTPSPQPDPLAEILAIFAARGHALRESKRRKVLRGAYDLILTWPPGESDVGAPGGEGDWGEAENKNAAPVRDLDGAGGDR